MTTLLKAPPGPPPRPGLYWNESTHRWRRRKGYKQQENPEDLKIISGPKTSKEKWERPVESIDEKGVLRRYTKTGQPIPPAWTNVWINQKVRGDLQAIGQDSQGRTVRLPSEKFVQRRAKAKYKRSRSLKQNLPQIRSCLREDFESSEEAKALTLIDLTGFRVGGKDQDTYGVTTMEGRHVTIKGNDLHFDFTGKRGVRQQKSIKSGKMAKYLRKRKREVGSEGQLFDVSDGDLRDYLRGMGLGEFNPKDFRTVQGTELARQTIKDSPKPRTVRELKQLKRHVGEIVSRWLGNTPAISLGSYIDPAVFRPIERGLDLEKAEPEWNPLYNLVLEDYSYRQDGWDGVILTEERVS